MGYQSFEELDVWKRACRQVVTVYKQMGDCKDWGLKSQIERSAVSVPSNIAEGCERDSTKDYARFLRIAKGSNAELRTQLYLAKGLDYLSADTANIFLQETKEIASMLRGLIKSLNL